MLSGGLSNDPGSIHDGIVWATFRRMARIERQVSQTYTGAHLIGVITELFFIVTEKVQAGIPRAGTYSMYPPYRNYSVTLSARTSQYASQVGSMRRTKFMSAIRAACASAAAVRAGVFKMIDTIFAQPLASPLRSSPRAR